MSKWNYSLDIEQYIGEDTTNEDIVKAAHGVVTELKKLPSQLLDDEIMGLVYEFNEIVQCDHVEDENKYLLDSFNYYLSMLYDWADLHRVWTGG